jgi:hypothetical protein
VIVYHGINDLHANRIPEADYRDDYSHMEWYRQVNWLDQNQERLRWSALPFVVRDLYTLFEKLSGRYRPAVDAPLDPDLGHDEVLKATPAFRSNLEALLDLAGERGDRVMLMTYAWYIPDGYAFKDFKRKQSGYTTHRVAVEGWGSPDAVARGLTAHNEAVRSLAAAHPEALFVDPEGLIPSERIYWNDVCHLTVKGTALLAGFVADGIEAAGILASEGGV